MQSFLLSNYFSRPIGSALHYTVFVNNCELFVKIHRGFRKLCEIGKKITKKVRSFLFIWSKAFLPFSAYIS